jgi:hypothetical protein
MASKEYQSNKRNAQSQLISSWLTVVASKLSEMGISVLERERRD